MLGRLWPRSLCIRCGLKSFFSYSCLWLNGAGLTNLSHEPGLIVDYEVGLKIVYFGSIYWHKTSSDRNVKGIYFHCYSPLNRTRK